MNDSFWMDNLMEDDRGMSPILTIEGDMDDMDGKDKKYPDSAPILPLRNNVLYPGVVIPISVGRDKSLKAVKKAYKTDKMIAVVAQKDSTIEEPEYDDLFSIGTLASIVKLLKMPDGGTTIIIQGRKRIKLTQLIHQEPYLAGEIEQLPSLNSENLNEEKAMISSLKDISNKIIDLSPNIPSEAKIVLNNMTGLSFLSYFIASNLNIDTSQKQELLEQTDELERTTKILGFLNQELQHLNLKNEIQTKVKTDIEKQQRDYFLNQQMKMIQEELGGDSYQEEIRKMQKMAKEKKWPKKIGETFDKEIAKLLRINPAAAEYSVLLNYLDTLLDLPWDDSTKDNFDLKRADKILDKEHYGLDKIKERILEYLAVLKLKGDLKSPILCFIGPPGVGKTSLGKSIAKALDRKYVRVALGGLHDESEIRGHRKTYIGAMPGRIIQSLKKVKSSNPVFILDEIDKVGKDFRGDPSSALLEVLDPEQNSTFYDNYLELEYDLSKVLFIATANDISSIQPALRDRMEIIYLSGYSLEEKIEIARNYLIKKQIEAHGLKTNQVKLSKPILAKIIDSYTRESGVRELDRVLASIMRYVAKTIAMEETIEPNISDELLEKILGKPKYKSDIYSKDNPHGIAVGLAWTPVGGDILFLETTMSKGKGILTLTGNLGDVMKESATTALTYIKANAEQFGLGDFNFDEYNIHIHVPEGAIPKDGPSAGIAMLSALVSLFTKKKIKPYLAMTGEITLRGKVLPVGGIKEKILAARRAGIKEVILCAENEKDVLEINGSFIKDVKFHYVSRMQEVIDLALV
jgi:ATP-dependent Lon protease